MCPWHCVVLLAKRAWLPMGHHIFHLYISVTDLPAETAARNRSQVHKATRLVAGPSGHEMGERCAVGARVA